ncbi:MAG: hypothetical protein Q9M27_00595 [Mariprofundaceae bacterium]|nr:hypothetical protein [Mariprofundaceae bacterium]
MKELKYLTVIIGIAASVYGVTAFLPMTAWAECSVSHIECEYPCIEYYPNGVDCKKAKKVCKTVCDDFDVIESGDTPHRGFSTQQFQQEKEVAAMQTINGILHRISAIGGETTGWAVRLEHPLQVSEKMTVNEIEVVADGSLLEPLQGKQVEARGQITWRQGIERGRYPAIMIETIHGL